MPHRRRRSFWLVLLGTTTFLSIEPALFLVAVALTLSGLALVWTVMLLRALLVEAFAVGQIDDASAGVCPLREWRAGRGDLSSSVRPTSSGPGAFS